MGFQLVLQAEFLPAAVTFVGLLPGVDAFVALQRVLVSEAAPAELALVRMVACWKVGERRTLSVLLLPAKPKLIVSLCSSSALTRRL